VTTPWPVKSFSASPVNEIAARVGATTSNNNKLMHTVISTACGLDVRGIVFLFGVSRQTQNIIEKKKKKKKKTTTTTTTTKFDI
jgi:D-serine deaminase-like pyridoxal phosphate-dependent protein